MFRFGKKKRYTIGEKLSYFRGILTDSKASIKKKDWARLRSKQLDEKKNKMRLGDVFVVNDHMVGSPHRKPRAVVIVKTPKSKSGQVTVIPVRKRKGIFPLLKFDRQRLLSANNVKVLQKNQLYELRGFRFRDPYLTQSEKVNLQKYSDEYIKK